MTATTSPSKSSNTLAIDGGPKAVTGFEAKPEPKIGVEEFLAIAKRFGFTPEALKRLAATVSDADLLGQGPNFGKYITSFPSPSSGSQYEAAAKELFGSPFALGLSSGTGALHAAMVAAGATRGKEVIVPALGFMATAAAAAITGATPVFCDVDESLQMDPKKIEECITPNTVAVAPTHHWSMVADLDPIMDIARRKGLKVVEDCAQSPGAKYKGKYVGTIGDLGCFSISAYKIIGGGEGGLVLAKDSKLFDRVNQLAECGGLWRPDRFAPPVYEGELFVGTNYRMSEFEATVDIVQLHKLGGIVNRFRTNYERITKQLISCTDITPQLINDRAGLIGYRLRFYPQTHELRKRVTSALQAEGVPAYSLGPTSKPDWHLSSEMFPLAASLAPHSRHDRCPVGMDLYRREVAVNIDQWWTPRDCDMIATAMNKVFTACATPGRASRSW